MPDAFRRMRGHPARMPPVVPSSCTARRGQGQRTSGDDAAAVPRTGVLPKQLRRALSHVCQRRLGGEAVVPRVRGSGRVAVVYRGGAVASALTYAGPCVPGERGDASFPHSAVGTLAASWTAQAPAVVLAVAAIETSDAGRIRSHGVAEEAPYPPNPNQVCATDHRQAGRQSQRGVGASSRLSSHSGHRP
jgi:hypothetical protein